MNVVYCDWSIRRGIAAVWNDEDEAVFYSDLPAVINAGPDMIILETTFESFDLAKRAAVMAHAKRQGVELLTIPNRLTSRFRKAGGFGEKDDAVDAKAIRFAAQSGVHLKKPRFIEPGEDERRRKAATAIMYYRSHGELTAKVISRGKNKGRVTYEFQSLKDDWARKLADELPEYSTLTEVQKVALGNGREYNLTAVAAVGFAAYHARNTREFDRLSGLYAHAYPGQIRADLMHYVWSGGNTRTHLNGTKEDGIRKRDDITLSQFRREIRWLYHQLKDVVQKVRPEVA